MKGESRKYVHNVDHFGKIQEKKYCKLQFLSENESNYPKVYSHPVKGVWISSSALKLIF